MPASDVSSLITYCQVFRHRSLTACSDTNLGEGTYVWNLLRTIRLCCTWACLATRACALLVHISVCIKEHCSAPRSVCLREPRMHLYVCFCAAPGGCLFTRAYDAHVHVQYVCFCAAPRRYLSSRAYNAAHVCFYLQELLCCFWVCLSTKAYFYMQAISASTV